MFLFWTPGVVFYIKYVLSGENSKYGHDLLRSSFFIKYAPLPQGKKKKTKTNNKKNSPEKILKLPCTNDNKIWLPGTIPSSFTTIAFELLSMLCFSQGSCAFVHKPHVWWHWTFTCRYWLFKKGGRKKTWESYFTFVLQIVPFNLQSEQRLTQFLLQSSWRLLATVWTSLGLKCRKIGRCLWFWQRSGRFHWEKGWYLCWRVTGDSVKWKMLAHLQSL